jgi:uncharacterized protein (TIGR02246 family)
MKDLAMTHTTEAIAAANAKFVEAYGHGDAAGVAACYAEDGAVLPPNAEIMRGRAAIAAFWQIPMNMGVKAVTLRSIEVEDRGDTAIEVGQYTLSGAAGQLLDAGKYVVIWKREQGEWQLFRDIWNSSEPAAA